MFSLLVLSRKSGNIIPVPLPLFPYFLLRARKFRTDSKIWGLGFERAIAR